MKRKLESKPHNRFHRHVFQQITLANTLGVSSNDSRWHVLHDAVEEVEALVVVGLGGDKLLEDSKQSRLKQQIR